MTRTFDLRRFFWVTVIAVAAILATSLTTVSEAQAQEQGHLRNKNDTNMCIGIDHGSTDNGALAKLFPCRGQPNQIYTFVSGGGPGKFIIKAGHSGKCLTEASGRNIAQYPCTFSANQSFFKGNVNGAFFSLVNSFGGQDTCIGVSGGGRPMPGAQIGYFPCVGQPNQQWRR